MQLSSKRSVLRRAAAAAGIASAVGLAILAPQVANAATVDTAPGQQVTATATFTNNGPDFKYGTQDNRSGVFVFNAPEHTKFTTSGDIYLRDNSTYMDYTGCTPTGGGSTLTCTGWNSSIKGANGLWYANQKADYNGIHLAVDADAPAGTFVAKSTVAATSSANLDVDLGVRIVKSYSPTLTRPLVDQNAAAGETITQSQGPRWVPNASGIKKATVTETADSNVILEPNRAVGDTWTAAGIELRKVSNQEVVGSYTQDGNGRVAFFGMPPLSVAPATAGAQTGKVTAKVTSMTDANGAQTPADSAATTATYTWSAPTAVDSPMVNPAVGAMALLGFGVPAAMVLRRRLSH